MSETVAVAFLEPYGTYNAGEIAGFEPSAAQSLVTLGVARYLVLPAGPDFDSENVELSAASDQLSVHSATSSDQSTTAGELSANADGQDAPTP